VALGNVSSQHAHPSKILGHKPFADGPANRRRISKKLTKKKKIYKKPTSITLIKAKKKENKKDVCLRARRTCDLRTYTTLSSYLMEIAKTL